MGLTQKYNELLRLWDNYKNQYQRLRLWKENVNYPELSGGLKVKLDGFVNSYESTANYVEPILFQVKYWINQGFGILPLVIISGVIVTASGAAVYVSSQLKQMKELELKIQEELGPLESITRELARAGVKSSLYLAAAGAAMVFLYHKYWR